MLKNYFLIAYRNFTRNKLFTLVNVFGLSTGLACFILIVFYVKNELSYDRHQVNHDRIYRIVLKGSFGGNEINTCTTGGITGELAEKEIPEIIRHVTIFKASQAILSKVGEKQFYQDKIFYVDSTFFELFEYEMLYGNPAEALIQPNSLVLTETTARKYFGRHDPLGQIIEWENSYKMVVRGVVRDPVHNSHLNFDVLASMTTLQNNHLVWDYLQSMLVLMTYNYILVHEGTSQLLLTEKLQTMVIGNLGEIIDEFAMKIQLIPQPIADIHLKSKLLHELGQNGDYSRIFMFSAIAILILVIACINFINLSTATSAKRAREVGIRKVFGACRSMLFRQFMFESLLITFLSLMMALAAVELLFPYFSEVTGIGSRTGWLKTWNLLMILPALVICVGFLAGFYPAVFLSSYQPVNVLKGRLFSGPARSLFRNALVVVQFIISALIIFSAVVIHRQMSYMNKKDLGIDIDQMVIVPLRNRKLISTYETLKNEIGNIPEVIGVSASSTILGGTEQRRTYYPEGGNRQQAEMISFLQVDYDFLKLYRVEMVSGRGFSENRSLDSNSVIINESMMKKLGWDQPLGKHMLLPEETDAVENDRKFEIIGVVKDFHFSSLHKPIEPLLIEMNPDYFLQLNIKIQDKDIPKTLSEIESKWQSILPDRPFDYFFLDSSISNLYQAEQKMSRIFDYFSILALFIASLGLFGLALYTTERRTREIGIRKVFGGSVKEIVYMLLGEFVQWVLLANIIAWPLAWYYMSGWLQNFAYRTDIPRLLFLIPAVVSMLIAIATVSWQSFRTAVQNPVKALRYE